MWRNGRPGWVGGYAASCSGLWALNSRRPRAAHRQYGCLGMVIWRPGSGLVSRQKAVGSLDHLRAASCRLSLPTLHLDPRSSASSAASSVPCRGAAALSPISEDQCRSVFQSASGLPRATAPGIAHGCHGLCPCSSGLPTAFCLLRTGRTSIVPFRPNEDLRDPTETFPGS